MQTPFSRSTFPPKGWVFREAATNWQAPTPLASTFDQTVTLIIQHRLANPASTAKNNLSTEFAEVANELEAYTRKRLGIDPLPKRVPVPLARPSGGRAVASAAAAVKSAAKTAVAATGIGLDLTAKRIMRAAKGTAVILDWLGAGGQPVMQVLATQRAAVCVECPKNTPGSWYTEAPAAVLKAAYEARKDLQLSTPYDDRLKSCDVCLCKLGLKVWVGMQHIVAKTPPEVMAEFPPSCWITKRQ